MSHYGWEHGEITLPRAEVVPMRRAIVARNNELADNGLRIAKDAWGKASAAQKRDAIAMHQLVDKAAGRRYEYGREGNDPSTERALQILGIYYGGTMPRPPQKQNAGHAGTSETAFQTPDLHVSFDAKSGVMVWDIGENNHAVENGHESWLGKVVRGQLEKVKWTRGTGGWLTGNDEYNEDPESAGHGRGSSYVTSAFGPIGAETHPHKTSPFTKSDGTRVTSAELSTMRQKQWDREAREARRAARTSASGPQGRVRAGSSQGGQFAVRSHSAPLGSLR